MIGSGIMSNEDLGSELRAPLIDQSMRIYQEEPKEFGDTSEAVIQVMAGLDEVHAEGKEQARHKNLSKGARTRTGGAAAQAGKRTSNEQAAHEMARGTARNQRVQTDNQEREIETEQAQSERHKKCEKENAQLQLSTDANIVLSSRFT